MRIDFDGQVAIVTGAGSGIGRAVSLGLARLGAKVLAVDISVELGRKTRSLIEAQGGDVQSIAADVSIENDVARYVDVARNTWGRIDVLMNNAGWQGPIAPIAQTAAEQFNKVMSINVLGVFLGLKHVLPIMVDARRGAVVNMGSLASFVGTRNLAPYVASKHAVLGLTKSAALEVARKGVRVNAVCPGPVDTPMLRDIEAAQAPSEAGSLREARLSTIPDGRYATPDEVADLMIYLASDRASHITGQGIQINGGSHA